MFSNHININILSSTIIETELQKDRVIEDKLPAKMLQTTNQDTAQGNSPTVTSSKKLNFQIINYKKQQIL